MRMKMYFHFRLNEPVLFRQWVPGNTAGYIFTCLAVFAIALTFELLRYFHNGFLRKVYLGEKEGSFHDCCHMPGEHSRISPDLPFKVKYLFRAFNIISPVLYFMEMYLSYSLMLVSMTYNVPFVASLLAGHILGYYLVGSKMSLSQDDEQADCCA
ncbi:unnamed protein product [Auanema sp. JU1783]|nr:unnamed protein product [Auanema sp. JU1783]